MKTEIEIIEPFQSTELLTKAFTEIHKEIFTNSKLDDTNKAAEIADVLSVGIESVNEFGGSYDGRIVYLTSIIKDKFRGQCNEVEIKQLCDDILKLTISANKYFLTYGNVLSKINAVIDENI